MKQWPAAVIFDFDGVIVNSEPLHCRAFREALAPWGIDLSEEAYYRDLIGFDDKGAFSFILSSRQMKLDGAEFQSLLESKSQLTREIIASGEFAALPGVMELVPMLGARMPLAICSGALRAEIELMLDGIGLRQWFPTIVAADDVTRGKPDPQGYLLTLERLGLRAGAKFTPRDCLIVEDAPTVIESVRSVGFCVLGVATTYPPEKLGGANWIVKGLTPAEVRRSAPELELD